MRQKFSTSGAAIGKYSAGEGEDSAGKEAGESEDHQGR
jgi:hypothetical protein